MAFPYRRVFEAAEKSLIEYGSRRKPPEQIRAALDEYKTYAGRELTDEDYFAVLVAVVFYSGFLAATVDAKWPAIERWFSGFRRVADYSEAEVGRIMSDRDMIRNRQKISACIENARTIRHLIDEHGSFRGYVESFKATDSFENLLLLKEDLEARFRFLGGVTVYHFLTDIGMPVLKPDRVICRIFHRLGLTEKKGELLKTVIHGRKFAEATELPIRYIDIVFVAYGQTSSEWLGIDRGICLEKKGNCGVCGLRDFCREPQSR